MIQTPEKDRVFDPNQLMSIDLIKTPVETKHLQRDAFSVSPLNPSVPSIAADLSTLNKRIICHEDFPRMLALLNQVKQRNEVMDDMNLNQEKKMNEPTEDMLQKSIRDESEATAKLMKERSGFNNLTIHRGDCPATDSKMQGYISMLLHRLKLKAGTPESSFQKKKTTREKKAEESEKKSTEKRKRTTHLIGGNTEKPLKKKKCVVLKGSKKRRPFFRLPSRFKLPRRSPTNRSIAKPDLQIPTLAHRRSSSRSTPSSTVPGHMTNSSFKERKTYTSPSSKVTTGRDKTLSESISRSGTTSSEKQCDEVKTCLKKDSIVINAKSPHHLSVIFP